KDYKNYLLSIPEPKAVFCPSSTALMISSISILGTLWEQKNRFYSLAIHVECGLWWTSACVGGFESLRPHHIINCSTRQLVRCQKACLNIVEFKPVLNIARSRSQTAVHWLLSAAFFVSDVL
ncbi:MAG: hypothetical protein WA929_03720, partial [Pseudomonas neustonica]